MTPRALLPLLPLLVGCFPPGEGVDVPLDAVYFPVGLALDVDASHLFVVNSDFDLQYNAGSVQSWDLVALRDAVSQRDYGKSCGEEGPRASQEKLLYPGHCNALDHRGLIAGKVEIGAFATDVVYRASPDGYGAGRLFVPVRGDATLHWIDTDAAGGLYCGNDRSGDGRGAACDAAHRSGDNDPAIENGRFMSMLAEPYGLDASEDGRVLLVSNQTSAAVGLLENDWSGAQPPEQTVRYWFTHSGLRQRPMGVAALPEPKLAAARGLSPDAGYYPGFLVGYRTDAVIQLVRAYLDSAADPPRPYTEVTNQSPIYANSNGSDSRGLAVDGTRRRREENVCMQRFGIDEACSKDPNCVAASSNPDQYRECLTTASAVPLDVFVPSRAPASLLIGQSQAINDNLATSDSPVFVNSVAIDLGPTRVALGDVVNLAGELERRVFVVCFDSRRVVVYDPARRRVESEIVTGRGPQAMVVDSGNGLGYVAHFTDSYVGVVDLDQRRPSYGTIVATVAPPTPPRASK
jgi:hypothetical protein